jgi:hypothetical protein
VIGDAPRTGCREYCRLKLGCFLFLRVEARGPHPVAFLRRIGGWRNEPLRVAAPRLTEGGGAELEPGLLGALVEPLE